MGNEEIKKIRSQKFFSDLNRVNCTQNVQGNPDDLNEKIALKASVTNIEKSARYSIQLFSVYGQTSTPLNEPQTCVNDELTNTAVLSTSIMMQYYFEKEQPLMVIVNKIGGTNPRTFEIRTTLGCVMGSRKNTLIKNIPDSNGEILNIAADKLKDSEDILILNIGVNPSEKVNFKDVKNKLVYHLMNSSRSPVYNSECINNQGRFNEVKIPASLLNQGIIILF